MKVLVDTSVWSAVMRNKKTDQSLAKLMEKLISEYRVAIIGPIRQEILSGIKDFRAFTALREKLSYFPDYEMGTSLYEEAASNFNICRSKGVQGSHIDLLICTVAIHEGWEVLTLDKDFEQYAKHLPLKLFPVG